METLLEPEVKVLHDIGNHLRYLRKQLGMSQEELAYAAGFSRSYYSDVETGKRNVSILTLYKLSIVFDIPLNDLLNIRKEC